MERVGGCCFLFVFAKCNPSVIFGSDFGGDAKEKGLAV